MLWYSFFPLLRRAYTKHSGIWSSEPLFPISRLVAYSSHRQSNISSNFNSVCVKDYSAPHHSPIMCGLLSLLAQERRYKFWPRATEGAELPHLSDVRNSSGEEWACQCPALPWTASAGSLTADVIAEDAHSSCGEDAGDKLDLSCKAEALKVPCNVRGRDDLIW